MTRRILFALIGGTTLVFSLSFLISKQYPIAVFSLALGLGWLLLEAIGRPRVSSFFFVCLIGIAAVASLIRLPSIIVLLGLSMDLAAWDLSRFLARTRRPKSPTIPELDRRHLAKLSATLCAGYALASLPLLFKVSIDFVTLSFAVLLAVIALRESILRHRSESQSGLSNQT
jgi:hypothetical protein